MLELDDRHNHYIEQNNFYSVATLDRLQMSLHAYVQYSSLSVHEKKKNRVKGFGDNKYRNL